MMIKTRLGLIIYLVFFAFCNQMSRRMIKKTGLSLLFFVILPFNKPSLEKSNK